jgi:hypothetical protein
MEEVDAGRVRQLASCFFVDHNPKGRLPPHEPT